jgi:hypothetical protein
MFVVNNNKQRSRFMLSLQKIHAHVQDLVTDHIPPRLRHRIICGIQAFSLQSFTSINANGRSLALNRKTGESRVYRALHDERTSPLLLKTLLAWLPQEPRLYCSLDHSQFGSFCIAVLAVSVRKGRAIPIWCQVNVSEAGLMKPLVKALQDLALLLPSHQKLVLVMDRWFCGKPLFEFIIGHEWYFICRTKYARRVQVPWENKSLPIGEISHFELPIAYHGLSLRMVRSNLRPGMKEPEPWFLLTNLPPAVATRRQIVRRYAQRFEIEETFKDLKWLQRLEWQQIKKPTVIQTLLFFIFFGWWLTWQLYCEHKASLVRIVHKKQTLSWFRTTWEAVQRLCWPDQLRFTPLAPNQETTP